MSRLLVSFLVASSAVLTAAESPDFFREQLYPAFRTAQCHACHNDNGVASGTRFEFPPVDATPAQIDSFGLRLARVVNAANPKVSRLYLMPTARGQHPGGERIAQGSDEKRCCCAGWSIWQDSRRSNLRRQLPTTGRRSDPSMLLAFGG